MVESPSHIGKDGDHTPAELEQVREKQQLAWRNLLFGLCFFNAVIMERRKYGAIGWNIAYQWMNSDFEISEGQL